MQDHGLLIPSKTMSWYAQHVDALEKIKTNNSKVYGNFTSFMQLTSPIGFDKLLEGMQHFSELKEYILK